jgi:hypothetical protein
MWQSVFHSNRETAMNMMIGQKTSEGGLLLVRVYKDRAKGSQFPFTVQAIAGREKTQVFDNAFDAFEYANSFLNGAYTRSGEWA